MPKSWREGLDVMVPAFSLSVLETGRQDDCGVSQLWDFPLSVRYVKHPQ